MNNNAFPTSSYRPGLTKLEYFAAQAMNGLLSDNKSVEKIITAAGSDGFAILIADFSFDIAEKMIERSKKVD